MADELSRVHTSEGFADGETAKGTDVEDEVNNIITGTNTAIAEVNVNTAFIAAADFDDGLDAGDISVGKDSAGKELEVAGGVKIKIVNGIHTDSLSTGDAATGIQIEGIKVTDEFVAPVSPGDNMFAEENGVSINSQKIYSGVPMERLSEFIASSTSYDLSSSWGQDANDMIFVFRGSPGGHVTVSLPAVAAAPFTGNNCAIGHRFWIINTITTYNLSVQWIGDPGSPFLTIPSGQTGEFVGIKAAGSHPYYWCHLIDHTLKLTE